MTRIGQQYRQGTWTINEKNIPAFIEAWQTSADWIDERAIGESEAILLQDSEEPTRWRSWRTLSLTICGWLDTPAADSLSTAIPSL